MKYTVCPFVFPPSFFQDGLKAVESLKPSIETLSTDLHTVSSFPPTLVWKWCLCNKHFLNVAYVNLMLACCAAWTLAAL